MGELVQNQFRIGMSRMERVIRERMASQDADDIILGSLAADAKKTEEQEGDALADIAAGISDLLSSDILDNPDVLLGGPGGEVLIGGASSGNAATGASAGSASDTPDDDPFAGLATNEGEEA